MKKVTYIGVSEGRVQFFADGRDWTLVGEGSTAKELADVIKFQSLDLDGAYMSSSMDFADEEGFANHDDAKKILNAALEMVGA